MLVKKSRVLRHYIRAAMHRAKYESLSDDGTFYGEIPGFDGVHSNADTLEAYLEELEEVLEKWILFRISKKLPLPAAKEYRRCEADKINL